VRFHTIVGERRMVTVDDMDLNEPVRLYDKGVDLDSAGEYSDTFGGFRGRLREGAVTIPRVGGGEPLERECQHFIDCIREGAAPRSGGPAGVAVVRALEAITRSLAAGGAEQPLA